MRAGLAAVQTVLEAGGVRVRRPRDPKPAMPYMTLRLLFDMYDGTSGCPNEDVEEYMQGTCVAPTDDGAMWLQDRVYQLLDETDQLTVELLASGPVAEDDDTASPSLFYAYPRWRVRGWVPAYQGAP